MDPRLQHQGHSLSYTLDFILNCKQKYAYQISQGQGEMLDKTGQRRIAYQKYIWQLSVLHTCFVQGTVLRDLQAFSH